MVTEGIPPRCISHLAQPLVTLHDAQVLSFQILAHSLALFCTLQNLNSFLFNRFRTLSKKPPGWGRGDKLLTENNLRISIPTSLLRYVLTSFSHREQQRLGGRVVGNGFRFRGVVGARRPRRHFQSFLNIWQLQGHGSRFYL